MKKILAVMMILVFVLASAGGVYADDMKLKSVDAIVSEIQQEQGVQSIDQINIEKVSPAAIEELGDSVMEATIGNTAMHDRMDIRLGGDGSANLTAFHSRLGYNYLINAINVNTSQTNFTRGGMMGFYGPGNMMGFYGPRNMMGFYGPGNMMGRYGWNNAGYNGFGTMGGLGLNGIMGHSYANSNSGNFYLNNNAAAQNPVDQTTQGGWNNMMSPDNWGGMMN